MIVQGTRITPLVKIRRARILPVAGTVLVRLGQKVTPSEILAESLLPTRHLVIDVMQTLGLKSVMEAEKIITRNAGETLDKNDIIAETGGLFSRILRAPMPGTIISIRNGQVLMQVENRKITVQSGFAGQVVEILNDRGAVVETNGALIQGVWGNGRIGFGVFHLENNWMESELTPATLGITTRGTVLAAAYCETEETLSTAADLPISGLILGGMNPYLIPCALRQPYPILLLEGFGHIPVNETARQILQNCAEKEVSLNAVKWDPVSGMRPEISIPLPQNAAPENEFVDLKPGQSVRLHTSPYCGKTGTLLAVHTQKTAFPNGLRTSAASIKIHENENVLVPLTNFDVLEVQEHIPG